MIDQLELDTLRHAYRAAIDEFDVATAVLAVHDIKRSEPTAEQVKREAAARGVLEEIKRLYLAAAHAAKEAATVPLARLAPGATAYSPPGGPPRTRGEPAR